MGRNAKLYWVRQIAGWKLGQEGESPELFRLEEAFVQGVGDAGPYYLVGRPWQVAFYLRFARRAIADGIDLSDPDACARLAGDVEREVRSSSAAHHILLHLFFPDRFERIASGRHKRAIAAAFATDTGDAVGLNDKLFNIRRTLAVRRENPNLDFYDDADLRLAWAPDDPGKHVPPPEENDGPDDKESLVVRTATLNDLSAVTHLNLAELEDIQGLLEEKRQVVFEGPPGSGKTYVAELFARWFAGAPLVGPPDERIELVQFHQSYGYEDFVQGIRPETDRDGRLRYRVRDGIFKQLCGAAARHPEHRYVLVIDEINRGNVARIFGELLLLLEYRDKRARLPYAAADDDDDDAYLSIPDNLYLIGTMNSTDRSLAQVDYAMRRRFYFRRFLPVENGRAPVLEGWLKAHDVPAADRERLLHLFVELNRQVGEHLSPDFQVGHSYFMAHDIGTPAGLDRVWRRAVGPLLEEYFHHHRDRDALLAGLSPARLLTSAPATAADGPFAEG